MAASIHPVCPTMSSAPKMSCKRLRNPVAGGHLRRCDCWGEGHFGAPRGQRTHQGVDIVAIAGQPVGAPMHALVVRVAEPYDDDAILSGLLLRGIGADAGIEAKLFYVAPDLALIGQTVVPGQCIGIVQSLQARYPAITDHVHLEIWTGDLRIDPVPLIADFG